MQGLCSLCGASGRRMQCASWHQGAVQQERLLHSGTVTLPAPPHAPAPCAVLWVATLALNFALSLLFLSLAILFWVLAAGIEHLNARAVSGLVAPAVQGHQSSKR